MEKEFSNILYQRCLIKAEASLVAFNQAMAQIGSKLPEFCKGGCDHCCHHIFFATNLEVDIIVKRLIADPALFAQVHAKQQLRQTRIAEHQALYAACAQDDASGHAEALAFARLKIPCALLHESKCLIYDIRPTTCAAYISIVPSRQCEDNPRNFVSDTMKGLLFEINRDFKRYAKDAKVRVTKELDVSHQVSLRLQELAKTSDAVAQLLGTA